MSTKNKREYRHITSYEIGQFLGMRALHGNGTKAVSLLHPGYFAPHARAFKLVKKSKEMDSATYIDDTLQQIGVDSVNRLGELVNSKDENVATRNVHFTIDHLRGKATQKSIVAHGKFNIQNVLD